MIQAKTDIELIPVALINSMGVEKATEYLLYGLMDVKEFDTNKKRVKALRYYSSVLHATADVLDRLINEGHF